MDNIEAVENPVRTFTPAEINSLREAPKHSMAPNTYRAYEKRWNHFQEWTVRAGFTALPAQPEIVCLYIEGISQMEDPYSVSTLDQALASIGKAHTLAGYPSPTQHPRVKLHRTAYKRRNNRPLKRARAVKTDTLTRLLSTCENTPIGIRDRALLLTGYALGLRSDNLVRLRMRNIQPVDPHFYDVILESSKTSLDEEPKTLTRGENASSDPICALEAWISLLNEDRDTPNYLFRGISKGGNISDGQEPLSTRTVSRILRKRAELADVPLQNLSAHSLRRGFVSQALENGASEVEVMRTTSHKSSRMLSIYNDGSRRKNPASGSLGL